MELNPYEKFLGDEDPVPVLFTTTNRLKELADQLTEDQLDMAPETGKWSIREIVAHMADCELAFGFRLRQTLSQEHAMIQPFDQEIWAERYGAYDFASAMAMFEATRNWNMKLLGTVSEADQHRPTTHPERGTMIFWTIVETMAGHDINHLEQVGRIVTAERV
ncbi:DinB family protein [Granulicella sp. dw_53]|uniref:DinB family protein n=1 Tax=Granulicella sp. dw_53 TaxID=2719792 RepID=UPI001BD2431D|nr:DinB family protein [Granulicella sp. dw_53]